MNTEMRLVVLAGVVAGILPWQSWSQEAAPGDPPTLSELKLNFDVGRAEAFKPLKNLDGLYRKQLEKLRNDVRSRGELDRVIAVDAEMKKLAGEKPENAGAEFHELNQLKTIYAKAKAERALAAQQKLLPLVEKQEKRLRALMAHLTRADKIDEAAEVQTELKAIASLEEQTGKTIESLKQASLGPGEKETPVPKTLETGLVLYYDFDEEPKGGVINDRTESGLNALVRGATWSAEGKEGAALNFDGVDDRLELAGALPDLNQMTVAVWIRYEAADGRKGMILSDDDGRAANDLMFGLIDESHVLIRADKAGATLREVAKIRGRLAGDWHHLAWVLEPDRSTVYVDGRKAAEVEQPGSNVGAHRAYIGYGHDETGWTFFHGSMDEFRIWERSLDPSEIKELVAATR